MSIRIRQYQPSDHEFVMKLHVEGLIQFSASIGNPGLDKDMERIEEIYLNNNGEFIVGLINDRIVSMGAYRKYDSETAEIKRIRIDQNYQKRGIGQLILTALESSAKDKGYQKLILDTTVKQLPAQKLFERNGYIEINRRLYKEMEIIYYEKVL
ncbi:GNAT family N-acetyltransferase [Paenibacillus radicis (ex Xue et al. 2023)]|uniref:GNAT family N-acetyltransferase n=1 Tax=Paenibacillus radicis (ex Xue et al. 2023) TaxID=2972489 RepID=A0ABT1YB78_9BACL|nr:GNAT family N-acetyltransferase [Paenibacillus radicis (ex Xue et al. 2023)]MCR8630444.1 GNAT family N-acetyltransferase [Paenibacillus radicis (ex Xue et al. 2023)]